MKRHRSGGRRMSRPRNWSFGLVENRHYRGFTEMCNTKAQWYRKLHGIRFIEAPDVIVEFENGEMKGVMGRS